MSDICSSFSVGMVWVCKPLEERLFLGLIYQSAQKRNLAGMFGTGRTHIKTFRISALALDSTCSLWYYNAHEETQQPYDEGAWAGGPQGSHDHRAASRVPGRRDGGKVV